MKMRSDFFGINAKMALAALAVCGLFSSCYEKEEIDTPVLAEPIYVITGNLVSAATGEAVNGSVMIGTETVATTNGFFKKEVAAGGSYIITVNLDGYMKATRTVFLTTVAKGQTSTANADIYLFDATTQVVTPDTDEPASKEETEAEKANVAKAVTDIYGKIPGLIAADIKYEVVDGEIKVTVPAAIKSSQVAVEVPYYAIEGFSSSITPATTKALTAGQIWIASAEKYLNRKYGFTSVERTAKLSMLTGYTITGYTMNFTMKTRVLSFKGLEGTVTYQTSLDIKPVYESHDSHDSHDGHGSNPGAGGGSSSNN